ncbi:MAG: hypothetical protein GX660_03885 [Clostridiaceae bacterium]|nr:hypothetical protein [Clostridiaceae bacterium]
MFDSIEELEQQVTEFQKNILASSTLVNTITELTSTIKIEIAKVIAIIDKNAEAVPLDIARTNADMLEKAEIEISKISDDALSEYRKLNQDYIGKLTETSAHITKMQDQLELRFTEFSKRLEATSVEKLFEQLKIVEKSLNIKINILIIGIGVTALLALLSLIVR